MTEPQHGDRPHSPGPSLLPIGFAVGVACILVGLIINPKVIVPDHNGRIIAFLPSVFSCLARLGSDFLLLLFQVGDAPGQCFVER